MIVLSIQTRCISSTRSRDDVFPRDRLVCLVWTWTIRYYATATVVHVGLGWYMSDMLDVCFPARLDQRMPLLLDAEIGG